MAPTFSLRDEGLFTLFVDNIPEKLTNLGLKLLFEDVGKVMDSFVSNKKRIGVEGPFGFIRFKKKEEALEAIKRKNNMEIEGKNLKVHWSKYSRHGKSKEGVKSKQQGGWIRKNLIPNGGRVEKGRTFAEVVGLKLNSEDKGGDRQDKGQGEEPINFNSVLKELKVEEKVLVEEWVRRLIHRGCVEEKMVIVVDGIEVLVHGVLSRLSPIGNNMKDDVGVVEMASMSEDDGERVVSIGKCEMNMLEEGKITMEDIGVVSLGRMVEEGKDQQGVICVRTKEMNDMIVVNEECRLKNDDENELNHVVELIDMRTFSSSINDSFEPFRIENDNEYACAVSLHVQDDRSFKGGFEGNKEKSNQILEKGKSISGGMENGSIREEKEIENKIVEYEESIMREESLKLQNRNKENSIRFVATRRSTRKRVPRVFCVGPRVVVI